MILSLPASCYEQLIRYLSQWFKNISEVHLEASTIDIRNCLIGAFLDDDEVLVSIDDASLFTIVPIAESTGYSIDLVYSRSEKTPVSTEVFAELMEISVIDIFSCKIVIDTNKKMGLLWVQP